MKAVALSLVLFAIVSALVSAKLDAGFAYTPVGPYPKECIHKGIIFVPFDVKQSRFEARL